MKVLRTRLQALEYNNKSKSHYYYELVQMTVKLSNLLGLLFGEMVTNLLIIPGDCCIGGVRHILSSFSVLGVISSPTRILSRLPSSTPFPNHRPHGNLHDAHILFIISENPAVKTIITVGEFLSKDTLTCKCAP